MECSFSDVTLLSCYFLLSYTELLESVLASLRNCIRAYGCKQLVVCLTAAVV
jgi:hypothetical protein